MSWPAQADKRRPGVYLLPAVSLLQLHENTTAPSTNNDGNINTGGKKAKKKRKKRKKQKMGLHSPIANRPARRSTRGTSDVGRRMSGRLTDASPSPSLFSLIGLRPRDAKQRRAPSTPPAPSKNGSRPVYHSHRLFVSCVSDAVSGVGARCCGVQ